MTHPIPNLENHFSNLGDKFSSAVQATAIANPHWVIRNASLAKDLHLDLFGQQADSFLAAFSGAQALPSSQPLAMVYAGHQFGHYVSQLGDGRGLLLGEIATNKGRFDLHLKGAGPTPYSRMGDGRAELLRAVSHLHDLAAGKPSAGNTPGALAILLRSGLVYVSCAALRSYACSH